MLIAVILVAVSPQGRTMVSSLIAPTPAPTPKPTPRTTIQTMVLPDVPLRPTLPPAEAYARVTLPGRSELIPLTKDDELTFAQSDGKENIIAIGENRVWMQSSTCDNQDCVHQGEVNLGNYETRVLFNFIMCLPNQISIELLTPAEAQASYEDMAP